MSEAEEPATPQEFSFFKALKSVIGQLKLGADITRITLPSLFSTPESLLETLALKRLRGFEYVRDINTVEDPVARMLAVMRWSLCVIGEMEEFGKKPLNPILGEVYNGASSSQPDCTVVSEQVSHHPPVTAFRVTDGQTGYFYEGAVEIATKFQGNSVSATWVGQGRLVLGDGDVYVCNRHYPPLVAKGLLMGAKRMALEGDITITHEKSGLVGKLVFQTRDRKIEKKKQYFFIVDGTVKKGEKGKALATVKGITSEIVKVTFPKGGDVDLPFIKGDILLRGRDVSLPSPIIEHIPEDPELAKKFSSVVWADVIPALKAQNFDLADEKKKIVEEAERAARAVWEEKNEPPPAAKLFVKGAGDHTWVLKQE